MPSPLEMLIQKRELIFDDTCEGVIDVDVEMAIGIDLDFTERCPAGHPHRDFGGCN
jgi:hypothetical protein